MDVFVVLIPLFPAIAAAVIGIGHLSGILDGEAGETTTAAIASWAIALSCLLALTLLGGDLLGKNAGSFGCRSMAGQRHAERSDHLYHHGLQRGVGSALCHPVIYHYPVFD